MRLYKWHLGAALLFPATYLLGNPMLAYVLAQSREPVPGKQLTPLPMGEREVSVVGTGNPDDPKSKKVFSFGITAYLDEGPQKIKADGSLERTIPSSALWPDAFGAIASATSDRQNSTGIGALRNPWEKRAVQAPGSKPAAISCGGIIIGGKDGDIAILNGRIFRRGDVLGGYRLEIISPVGVAIRAKELLFVIPLGRQVIIVSTSG